MRVDVYRNLRKHCWSVRNVKTRLVEAHTLFVVLTDAKFLVSESGRNRVRKEKRKNVHAWVRGHLTPTVLPDTSNWHRVIYDPYKFDSFVLASGHESVSEASMVLLDLTPNSRTRGVFALV